MTIIGVILSFRSLCQEALNDVLQERIPFLLSSIVDFKHHVPNGDNMVRYPTLDDAHCSLILSSVTYSLS